MVVYSYAKVNHRRHRCERFRFGPDLFLILFKNCNYIIRISSGVHLDVTASPLGVCMFVRCFVHACSCCIRLLMDTVDDDRFVPDA